MIRAQWVNSLGCVIGILECPDIQTLRAQIAEQWWDMIEEGDTIKIG